MNGTLKFLDCSDAEPRPHRNGGPVQNDVMRYLSQYAWLYRCERVTNLSEADVVITNTTFLQTSKPKLKRMDGIFSYKDLVARNEPLNAAALEADAVVFISKFSYRSLRELYPSAYLRHSSVVLNEVDPSEFHAKENSYWEPRNFIAVASDWNRVEKRGRAVYELAKSNPHYLFHLIGKPLVNVTVPNNCVLHGYISNYNVLCKLYQYMDAMIHLGWRDPAPKTVLQGLACHLPVFYTLSGGNEELVENYGLGVEDGDNTVTFVDEMPPVTGNVQADFSEFCLRWRAYKELLRMRQHQEKFRAMLDGYFSEIKSLALREVLH